MSELRRLISRSFMRHSARFIALAKQGHPFEGHIVTEDVPGKAAEPITAALQFQQRDHMERGVEYARKILDLGIKWRS